MSEPPRVRYVRVDMGRTVGLPRMAEHAGERRDFLPAFVQAALRLGADEVVLEEGYGAALGIPIEEYQGRGDRVRIDTAEGCLDQDVIVALRCPSEERLERLRPGAILVTMLHYPTRPLRTQRIRAAGVRAVSLDSVTDDRGRRLVENLELTAWVGVTEAFRQLADGWSRFASIERGPVRMTILGTGALGMHAVRAGAMYGDHEMRETLRHTGVPGVEVASIDFDLSWHESYMLERLRATDLLADATRRPDPTVTVVPNAWLSVLPEHAVLLDLAADPYDFRVDPPHVKAIEGLPDGSLERFVFDAWDRHPDLDTRYRRVSVSCPAWPGHRPRESMERYGEQLEGILGVVLRNDPDAWSRRSFDHHERAVARAELERWIEHHD